ncbi:malonyl CoA-acyl carrier protein transacylase [Campylobacterota bacterium]|nr:malonyl CoA-acyl carrier protein transacylase [Campylobacterota bacterium]
MKKIAFLFPGQGSQAVSMGKSFVDRYEVAAAMLSEASSALGYDLSQVIFEENDRLSQTTFTQPAILFVSLVAHRLFENELPIKPLYALGHSLGELSAVAAMGAIGFADALKLAAKRGELMAKACEGVGAGMMVLLGLSDEAAADLCAQAQAEGKQIYPANYNSDGQIVIAGLKADLAAFADRFKAAGAKRTMLLEMSVASHCPLLLSAKEPLQTLLNGALEDHFLAPIVSNATAKPYDTKAEAAQLLADQLVKPVLYKQSIKAIENEVDLFIEFGHGAVLKGLNKKITAKETVSVATADDLESLISQLIQEV